MSKMENMPICDLRNHTDIAVIQAIESIQNVAMVILPKEAPSDVLQALHSIPMRNVAAVITLDRNDRIQIINGLSVIGNADLGTEGNTTLVVNGIAVIADLSPEVRASIYLNGIVLIQEKLRSHPGLNFAMTNGIKVYANFAKYKLFPDEVTLDLDFLTWLDPDTVIAAGNKIIVGNDVTIDLLREKRLTLVSGNVVVCPAALKGYIQSISTVGNKIVSASASDDETGPATD
jgi:hypothetical protein